MAIRFFLVLLLFTSCTKYSFSLYEDQVGLMDWHQQYIGKVKHAVFHTQKTGRKRVLVSTEENVVASLDLRRGEIFWRHVLGIDDVIDGLDIAQGKYAITLSSDGSLLRAWNLPDGQMVWESLLQGSKPSKSILNVLATQKVEMDNVILVFGYGCLHAVSSIDGEVLWRTDFVAKRIAGLRSNIAIINVHDGEISYQQTVIAEFVEDTSEKAVILPSRISGMFALELNSLIIFIKLTDKGKLVVVDKVTNAAAIGDALLISEGQNAFALVQHGVGKIHLTVKDGHDWSIDLLKESTVMDPQRGKVNKNFINNYVQTNRAHGFRALIVMEDHSLLLVQQGEIVWRREDGLASVVDVVTSKLPVEKVGVSVAKVEQNLFEWLKGHLLKLKGTLMLASPEDVVAIQAMRLRSSEKSKMTRDHNGFRKLLIVLTRAGKLFALHTRDGRVIWSVLLRSLCKSETCEQPVALNVYQWQVPHHHAMDENPSVLVIGRCRPSFDAPNFLSFVDTYTGREVNSLGLVQSITQIIPLLYTDSTEQRLHLLIDINQQAYLYPKMPEAIAIMQHEFSNVYWYSVDVDNDIIKGHALKSNCVHEVVDEYCFNFRDLWSVVFPPESENIIATVTRKSNEVVHTQTKAMAEQDIMYKYISRNLLFVATVAPKARGEIGTASPEESWLVVYLIETVTGRILHRMVHHGSQGPVHAVFSENWVVYHYFNLRAHKYEISVIEIYDQSRADNKDVRKLILGKHNLTSPISSYSRPEVITKSHSYFFTHSVKAIAVTSTAKGITSKQLLIGTIGDQVLALDKRYLDLRRSVNPTQAEKEEGVIPLTDSLLIIPQSYITHSLKVEGLRGIVTVPAKLESTSLVFAYGVDLFFTRMAPSRTYDSLTEDFSYALLLITIVALIAAIFVTWVLSERKELQEKWR
ncbi:ER membrane protein complex subunit 1 [Quillaja saponaria]|uniref:ER membrane protein complex subunit 1 n=1 Tax=Quillaja saponaria TaxID=32244 RepID=A0AAD7PKU2_QUISA|nr:ER membrane protein complex subunit 1 [Quillaja saponaria]